MKIAGLAALCLGLLPVGASAVPITYTVVTTGEFSSLNGGPQSSAPLTFIATADTADLREQVGVPTGSKYGTVYANIDTIPLKTLTVTIGGSPTATFLKPFLLEYGYGQAVALTDVLPIGVAYAFYSVPTPPTTPDVLASAVVSPVVFPNFAFYGSAATDLGTLSVALSPTGYTTTLSASLATPVPEPGSAALVGTGLVGLLSIGFSRFRQGTWPSRTS